MTDRSRRVITSAVSGWLHSKWQN